MSDYIDTIAERAKLATIGRNILYACARCSGEDNCYQVDEMRVLPYGALVCDECADWVTTDAPRLTQELDLQSAYAAALDEIDRLREENERLREALRPFGEAADHAIESIGKATTLGVLVALAPYYLTWQDFRRARAALRNKEASHDR